MTQTKPIRVLSRKFTRGYRVKGNGQDVFREPSLCRFLSFQDKKWDRYTREASSPGCPRVSAPREGAREKLECLPSLASKVTEHPCCHGLFITRAPLCWLFFFFFFQGEGIRFHLLMKGVPRNLWTCFKTTTPPVAPSSAWGHDLLFFPRLMDLRKHQTPHNPEQL